MTKETRQKIGRANRKRVKRECSYCKAIKEVQPSKAKRYKRHYCSTKCYSADRKENWKPYEQNSWKGGVSSYEAHRKWVAKNKERMSHLKARRYAREKGADGSHTLEEWQKLKEIYGNVCAVCKEHKPLTKDHVMPLSKGGSDYITNIQPLCRNCNSKKWSKF